MIARMRKGRALAMEQRGEVEILRSSNIKEIADEAGRPRISFAELEYTALIFDRVIFALGGTTPTNFLHTLGITFDGDGPAFDEARPNLHHARSRRSASDRRTDRD